MSGSRTRHLCMFVQGVAILVGSPQLAAQSPPQGVAYERDIVCGKAGDQQLRLDLARPEQLGGSTPVVVVIHGGAWRGGKKDEKGMTELLFRFARNGYISASVQYRLCPQHRFPAQVEDVKCAIRFLRANADKYQLDPQRIGALGLSAGAHLAMLLGVMGKGDGFEGDGGWADQPSQVQVVVSMAGPTQLDAPDIPLVSIPLVTDLIGGSVSDRPEDYQRASPVTYVSSGDAPMLLFQGTKDPLVPHTQAYRMADALTNAGVPGRVELYVGAGHGWSGKDLDHSLQVMDQFFDRYLRPEKK